MNKQLKRRIAIFFSIVTMIVGVVLIGYSAFQYITPMLQGQAIEDLYADVEPDNTAQFDEAGNLIEGNDAPVNPDQLAQKAPDAKAWVKIDGTRVNNPVGIAPANDEEYYLYRDIWGNYSQSGTVFLDNQSSLTNPTKIIYGHKMNAGTMFHDLGEKFTQANFNELGALTWWDKVNWTSTYTPVAAMKVDANYTDVRNTPTMSPERLAKWEKDFYDNATAKNDSADIVARLDGHHKVMFAVTCSGYAAYGHDARTIVMFVSNETV